MSGGPPHHPHNRPNANAAWNHLQVPNYFPARQPQHAHMSNDHPLLHQPTWHTPTTEPLKTPLQHSHLFNLEQMLSDRPFPRHSPGVDLSVTRNGSQNGDLPTTPISLSVRDTNKINSLAASALEIQGTELKAISPGLKSNSPGLKSNSPGLKSNSPSLKATELNLKPGTSPSLIEKQAKKAKRVDSILERLNPQNTETSESNQPPQSVIVQASSSHDENSNSSSILNVPTPSSNIREDDVVSPYSNEDSLDSNKSRRKRKPSKTIRVTKEVEPPPVIQPVETPKEVLNENKMPERRKTESPEPVPRKTRRKTSSESETIDKIAAMVQETAKKTDEPPPQPPAPPKEEVVEDVKPDNPPSSPPPPPTTSPPTTTIVTLAQKKDFVAVEDKLEEMFAGLEEEEPVVLDDKPAYTDAVELLNLETTPSTSHDNVTSTSGDMTGSKKGQKKRKLMARRSSEVSKKKKVTKKGKVESAKKATPNKKVNGKAKLDTIKDVYAYDSGSNASSSKSKGPFVQIRGPRDSPLSVAVINTPVNDEDAEKKPNKSKKFHDDTEYRHKVRSKGLHCSTLSNKYDAQTKDATWICAFCKRGPYSAEFSRANELYYTPGDLFGPYVITNSCPEFDRRMEDPYDRQFKSKKVNRTLDSIPVAKPKKSKRKNSEGVDSDVKEFNLGITTMDAQSYEIWAHEDCIVWSPGIYLVGPKIVGLEEAVWTSSNVSCSRCHTKGANICCLRRGCPSVVHVGCAYISKWQLDESNYKAFCVEHKTV